MAFRRRLSCVSRSCAGSYLLIAARAACLAELQRTECIGRRNRFNNILSLSLHGCYLDALVVTQAIHFLPHTERLWPQTLDIAMHRTTIVQDLLLYVYIYIYLLEHKSLPLCVHTDLHTDIRYHNKYDM